MYILYLFLFNYYFQQVLKNVAVTMRLGRSLIPFEVKVRWTCSDQQPSHLEQPIIIEGAKNYGLTVTTPLAIG